MSQLRDEEARVKKWEKCFGNSDVDIAFEDVIVCLANVGLLQLQLESPTSMGNQHLIQLDDILEEMYRDVGCILQCQNLLVDKCDALTAVSRRTQVLHLNLEDKVLAGKLQCILNAVKMTVAGSTEASTKFINSSFLHFLQMIDDLIVRCPWLGKPGSPQSLCSCAFVYECPEVSRSLAYKCVDELKMKRYISTLITLDDLITTADSGSDSNLPYNETKDKNKDLPKPPSEILTTDLIVEQILRCLPAQDCLRLRLVNQRFNFFAVQTVQRHHSDQLKIHFEYDLQTNEFFCPKLIRGIYHELKLTDLTQTMTLNSTFPCVNFSFVQGTIASPDIQEFLEAHGNHVKMLHLNLYCEDEYVHASDPAKPPLTQFLAILTRQATHLQTLSLEGFPKRWIDPPFQEINVKFFPPSAFENVKLKNLHSLQFESEPPKNFVKELLAVAEDLKNVTTVYDLSPFIEMNKFYLLKDLIWDIYTEDDLEQFNALNAQFNSNSVSNLRTLGYYISTVEAILHIPPSLTSLIANILECSAKTLRVFHVMGPMGIFEGLRFPVLPKVKELRLTSRPKYEFFHQCFSNPFPIFPPRFCPAQVFPALQKITIGFITVNKIILNWNASFGNCFENNPLVTVKHLEIQEFRDLPPGWLENLAVVCPCVEFIDVKSILYNFPEDTVKGLWNFKKLKSLKLKINVWATENAFPAIDRVFTGFSNETCLELFNGIDQTDLESIGGLRAHASLLDLKELTKLKLTFADVTLPPKIRENPIITQVTGLYAFAMCPQLKVCVEAEGRTPELSLKLMQDLEPLFPFVHLHIPKNVPSEHFKLIPHLTGPRGNVYNDSEVLISSPAV